MKRYFYDNEKNYYRQEDSTAFNEAVIVFTGTLNYSNELPENLLEHMKLALSEGDFAFAPISLGSGIFTDKAKSRFVRSVGDAGFDACVFDNKSSKKYEEDTDISLIPEHSKIIDINEIKFGFANVAIKNSKDIEKKAIPQIQKLKNESADFIFFICSCRKLLDEEIAKIIAENGADYIVIKSTEELNKYCRIKCRDGRIVPVINSVGNSVLFGKDCNSAVFTVKVLRDYSGKFVVEDRIIPCIFTSDLEDRKNQLVPTRQFYNGRYSNEQTKAAGKKVRKLLGQNIKVSEKKRPFRNKSGFTPQMSIQEICDVLGVSSDFYDGEFPIDEKVHSIIIRRMELTPKCVAVLDETVDETKAQVIITENLIKETRPVMAIANRKIEGTPTLVVESPSEAFITLAKHIRMMYDPFTVAITGSIGKSTVTDMIKNVMSYKYKCPNILGNYNTFRSIGFCVQKLNSKYTGYVQEIHGGSKGAASLGSSIVMPNVSVITNIAEVHLQQLGNSIEGVKKEKLGIMDHIQEGGALVVNNDNEYLQNLDVPVKVVTYAAFNKNSDYYAEEIVELEDRIKFKIVCDEGKYDAEIFCRGKHNVCNAIGAFAVGRLAGIEPHRITSALSRYRTSGFRQNLIKKDGYKIFADCFNSAPESVKSALQSISSITPTHGGKRIAVLGDMNELAEMTEIRHREMAATVAESDVDVLITIGEFAMDTAEEAKKLGMEVYGFLEKAEMEEKIKEIMKPGDVLLFKASHSVQLEESIENIFGKIE